MSIIVNITIIIATLIVTLVCVKFHIYDTWNSVILIHYQLEGRIRYWKLQY